MVAQTQFPASPLAERAWFCLGSVPITYSVMTTTFRLPACDYSCPRLNSLSHTKIVRPYRGLKNRGCRSLSIFRHTDSKVPSCENYTSSGRTCGRRRISCGCHLCSSSTAQL